MKINRVKVSRVFSVFDGDTFRCDVDTWPKLFGYHIPVRVRGINCPERRSKDPIVHAESVRAWRFTKDLLTNAKVIELVNVERGKYFRLVADVVIDGRDLATLLLSGGLAVRARY